VTPDEALYHLRKDLADAVDAVAASNVGKDETRQAIAPYAAKLRKAADLDEGAALAEELEKITLSDPPVYDRLRSLTQGVREQAEAETIPGQLKSAAKKVATGIEIMEVGIGLFLLWQLFDKRKGSL
jgi:hypothetical protein